MVNWMVEVTRNFKCCEETFFLAVSLMDRYTKKTTEQQLKLEEDLHLMGLTCMFVASKFEDRQPLTLHQLVKLIGHGKFTPAEVKAYEIRVLKALNYQLAAAPTVYYFLQALLNHPSLNKNKLRPLQVAVFLAKLTCHDYHLSTNVKPAALARSVKEVADCLHREELIE